MNNKYIFSITLMLVVSFNYIKAQTDNNIPIETSPEVSATDKPIDSDLSAPIVSKPTPIRQDNPINNEEGSSSSSGESDKNFGPIFNGLSVHLSAGANIYFGDIAAYKLFPNPSQFSKHVTGGFKAAVSREIKWGLGAQLNYQRGSLIGTRKTGKYSSTVTFEARFYDISLQVRYPLSDALFKKSEYSRFKLFGYVGFGSAWYRSQLYDSETLGTKDYEGYIEVEQTKNLAQKTLSDKVPKAQTWIIPYGVTLVYKHNHKMDFHLDFTQTATTTDRLDAFSRDWTARDKYDYIGVGVTYNFNRTADDAPKKRAKKEETKTSNVDEKTSSKTKSNSNNKLFGKKKKTTEDDELLNIRLKLFETQLKLFEMQYLIGK